MPDNSRKTVVTLVVFVFSIILLTAFAGASEERIGSGASLAHPRSGFDQTRYSWQEIYNGGVLRGSALRRIADLATKYRLPAMYPAREYIDAGG